MQEIHTDVFRLAEELSQKLTLKWFKKNKFFVLTAFL